MLLVVSACNAFWSFLFSFPNTMSTTSTKTTGTTNATLTTAGRLKQTETKRSRVLKRLDAILYVNAFLSIPAIIVILLTVFRLVIPGSGFPKPQDKVFFITVSCIFALNLVAIGVYYFAVMKKKKTLLIWYLLLDFLFVVLQSVFSVTLYTGSLMREEDDDNDVSVSVTSLFIPTLVFVALNAAVMLYVNRKLHQLTGYTKTYNTTLTASVTQSKVSSSAKTVIPMQAADQSPVTDSDSSPEPKVGKTRSKSKSKESTGRRNSRISLTATS